VTDFLTSLAARSLGQEAVIQPRPEALFEPDAKTTPEVDLVQEVETVAEVSPRPRSRRQTLPLPTALAYAERLTAHHDENPAPEASPAVIQEHPPISIRAADPVVSPEPVPAMRQTESSLTEVLAARRSARPTETAIQPDERRSQVVPATVAPALRPAEAGSRTTAARRGGRNPAVHVDAEPQAPIVRVTIGRVDVRAVIAPPEQPRRTPSKPTRMTLDEYLAKGQKS
jgi:hypothetical protein